MRYDRLVAVPEAAEFLGISPGSLRNLVWKREVPCYKIGARVRFKISELQIWIEQFEQKAAAKAES